MMHKSLMGRGENNMSCKSVQKRLAATLPPTPSKQELLGALCAIFRDNAIPMSDYNGKLYDKLADFIKNNA
jgi:hypothetical protein